MQRIETTPYRRKNRIDQQGFRSRNRLNNMFGTESTGSLNTAAGQHHRVNGTFNLYLFNNLTSSSSNNPQTPPLLDNLNTTTSPMNVSGNDGRNLVVVGVLIGLIVLLCLFLALVAAPPLYAIWRSSIPVNPQKIERRYRTIEGWLISKVSVCLIVLLVLLLDWCSRWYARGLNVMWCVESLNPNRQSKSMTITAIMCDERTPKILNKSSSSNTDNK